MSDIVASVQAKQDEILDFLQRLVNMESPSHEKQKVDAVIDLLETSYRKMGFTTRRLVQENFGNHLVADFVAGEGPRVLMVGHADTVFASGTLSRMPLKREGERLLGPAVSDMKGGLTVMLYGIRTLLDLRNPPGGALRVVINSDEEPGSPTSRDRWPELAKDVDYAMILEPAKSDGSLVYRRKGVGIFHLDIGGKAAHAGAEPEKGASAIRVLAKKILDIEALANPALGSTINTGVIAGGTEPYVVPESAHAEIDFRVTTLAEKDRILASLRSIVDRQDLPGTRAELKGQFHRPPMEPAKGFDGFRKIVEDAGASIGAPVRWMDLTGGASDGNNISALGIPTVDGMGPSGAGAHGVDEYMDIPSLYQKTALLTAVLLRLFEKRSKPEGSRK